VKGETSLIGFLTAGLPSPERTALVVESMIKGGIDILELGIPFSDPIADGPTIQAASHKALSLSMTPQKVFRLVEQIKAKHNIPIVLLTYFNPIYRMGIDHFINTGKSLGLDGIIVPDLPIEESGEYCSLAEKYGLDTIFLASPATSIERLQKIISVTSGFLYLVSIYGVTGTRSNIEISSLELVKKFKQYTADRVNLAVGFGISKPEHVKRVVSSGADGAIVGSAYVKMINEIESEDEMLKQIETLTSSLKKPTRLHTD
jgi:tryptophan synthase alpha chain